MWKCKSCKALLPFNTIKPAIDQAGLHFICPACQHRNILINVGTEDLDLMQLSIGWDEFKARTEAYPLLLERHKQKQRLVASVIDMP